MNLYYTNLICQGLSLTLIIVPKSYINIKQIKSYMPFNWAEVLCPYYLNYYGLVLRWNIPHNLPSSIVGFTTPLILSCGCHGHLFYFDNAKLQQFSHISKYFMLKSVKPYVKNRLVFAFSFTKGFRVISNLCCTGFQHLRNTLILSLGEKIYDIRCFHID